MKLVKSLLLGSAAGLAAVAGAQAADLPVRKAAPVEYVRVCSAYGVGFFYIPGTETCLRVSGFARFEYNVASSRGFAQDNTGFRSIGRLNLDARTQTAYGTLRSFVRFDMARRTGHFFSGTAQRRGEAEIPTGVDFAGKGQTQITLDKAFIQFAGITAGRATSFFDFYSNDLTWFGITGSDRAATNLLAYTASFGGGWSATLSLEDPQERRWPIIGLDANGIPLLATVVAGAGAVGSGVILPGGLGFGGPFNVGLQQRNSMPDVVANVRVDQTWGSFQLSGAVHQISAVGTTNTVFGTPVPVIAGGLVVGATPNPVTVGTQGFRPDTEYGWALQAGLKVNLPMIAPGDLLYLQAAYARGGLDYTISGNWVFGGATGSQGGFGGTLGRFAVNTLDGVLDQFGEVNLSRSWSAIAGFLHYWTPQLRSGFAVGYSKIEYPSANSLFINGVIPGTIAPTPGFAFGSAAAVFATTGTLRDFSLLNLAANLIWSPVRDLDIGVEVAYDRIKVHGGSVVDLNKCGNVTVFPAGFFGAGTPAQACGFRTSHEDEWRGRLRLQRSF
jgi:hypothetical protein